MMNILILMLAIFTGFLSCTEADETPDPVTKTKSDELLKQIATDLRSCKNKTILDATFAVYLDTDDAQTNLKAQTLTRAAFKTGVKIAAGSNIPEREGVLGAHVEYRLLADKIGMTPSQVLHAAVIVNAEAAAFENKMGVIDIGKEASFLVYAKDPLQSVKSWATPFYVVKHGTIYSGKELRKADGTVTPLFASNNETATSTDSNKVYPKEFENLTHELDKNKDGHLVFDEFPDEYKSQFEMVDKKVTKEQLIKVF